MTGPSLPTVGVIGAGAMGMGVVRCLLRGRYKTVVRDIRRDAETEAASLGAQLAVSPADLAKRAPIAILLVVDDRQIEAVLFGTMGAAPAFRPGSVVIVSSTVDPQYVAALTPRLAAHGLELLDAPVSGGPAKAAAGTMTVMLSGPAGARRRCRPVLDTVAGKVFEVGERPGDAASFKIVNNLLAAANLAAGAEAMALACKAGLDPQRVFDVVCASSGASWIFADRMPRALAGDFAPRAAARILAKDVGIAVEFARRIHADAPFANAARQAFADALAEGFAEEDDAAIVKLFARRAGIPPPGR